MRLWITSILLALSLCAEVTFEPDYKTAVAKAEKENKLLMVMLTREGCPTCEYMMDVVFENEAVANTIMEDFIPLHLDIHNDYLHKLDYIGTPTFHFITHKGYKRHRHDGGANVKDFSKVLKAAVASK